MNLQYIRLLTRTLPDAGKMDHTASFDELSIDSFDLLSIRVEFERYLNSEISDRVWTEFRSFSDLFAYCDNSLAESGAGSMGDASPDDVDIVRLFDIGMPQMAIGSISENWLFRELGDAHWEMLCRGLDRKSSQMADEMQNRLYATFARVQIRGSQSLAAFKESEPASLSGNIARYGNGMYFSSIGLEARSDPSRRISANLITSFSRRAETGNKNLVKSHPSVTTNSIENVTEVPDIVNEYRLIKKGEVTKFELLGFTFEITDDLLWEYTYSINPYYDINGASLLYFASYPTISDYCTMEYLNQCEPRSDHAAEDYHTLARDVMYYANCDMYERIAYRLHSNTF